MTPDPSLIASLVSRILAERAKGRPWEEISRDYPAKGRDGKRIVKRGTLCRIALSGGAYLPKDRRILRALGLIQRRKRTEMEKRIDGMARETRKALK